jgi:hypothetical protein
MIKKYTQMIIANPIYDSVFKYLMEDNEIAMQLVSLIIHEEVMELGFAPEEYIPGCEHSPTVYRMDLLAKIATPNGSKSVLIDMKKAKLATDILRVRRYYPLPTYCIYFLGYVLDDLSAPVLRLNSRVQDAVTGEVLNLQNKFIECLNPRLWVIQIPLLAITFKQENLNFKEHILNIKEEDFPEKYRFILRRLRQAAESPQVKDEMALE